MSPLPHIHAATPVATLREPVSAAGGSASPKSGFAEVMREVFRPVHAPAPARHSSSVLSHSQASADAVRKQPGVEANSSTTNESQPSNGDSSPQTQADSRHQNQIASSTGIQTRATAPTHAAGRDRVVNASGAAGEESGLRDSRTAVAGGPDGPAISKGSILVTQSVPLKETQSATSPDLSVGGSVAVLPSIASNGFASKISTSSLTAGLPAWPQAGAENVQRNLTDSFLTGFPGLHANAIQDAGTSNEFGVAGQEPVGNAKPGTTPDSGKISSQKITSGVNPAQQQINDGRQTMLPDSGNLTDAISQPTSNQDSADQNAGAAVNPSGDQVAAVKDSSTYDAANGAANALTGANTPGSSTTSNLSSTSGDGKVSAATTRDSSDPKESASQNASAGKGSTSTPPLSALPGTGVLHESAATPNLSLHASSNLVSVPTHANSIASPGASNTLPASVPGTPSEAFAALDNAVAVPHGILLQTAPHQVSMGVSDPTLGWVEVRAERVAGQMSAALTADSAASHAALVSVLPAMANYLQQQHSGLQHVHVETALAGGQTGSGGQGQSNPQRGAHTPAEHATISPAGSIGLGPQPSSGAHFSHEPAAKLSNAGHQVSVRA